MSKEKIVVRPPDGPLMDHHLKIWPQYYQESVSGQKKAQLRKNDRDYRVGDRLILHEWNPELGIFTGPEAYVKVTDVMKDCEGLVPGFCILSVEQKLGSLSSFNAKHAGKTELCLS